MFNLRYSLLIGLGLAIEVFAQKAPTVREAREELRDRNLESVARADFYKNLGVEKRGYRILKLADSAETSSPSGVDLAAILGHEKTKNGQKTASKYVPSILQANLSSHPQFEHWTTVKLIDFSLDDEGTVATIEYSTTEQIEVRSPGIDAGYGTVTVPGPTHVHQKTVTPEKLRLVLYTSKYVTLEKWHAYLVAMQYLETLKR